MEKSILIHGPVANGKSTIMRDILKNNSIKTTMSIYHGMVDHILKQPQSKTRVYMVDGVDSFETLGKLQDISKQIENKIIITTQLPIEGRLLKKLSEDFEIIEAKIPDEIPGIKLKTEDTMVVRSVVDVATTIILENGNEMVMCGEIVDGRLNEVSIAPVFHQHQEFNNFMPDIRMQILFLAKSQFLTLC